MFDIGAAELLLVAIVALVVIGPKDLPGAMRGVGKVLGQMRGIAGQFRFSLDSMIREAEMEEQEKEWAARNEKIMEEHPQEKGGEEQPASAPEAPLDGEMKPKPPQPLPKDASDSVTGYASDQPDSDDPEERDDRSQNDLFGDKT